MNIDILLTVNQSFELNEMFYMYQAKHMLKYTQDIDLYKDGTRMVNLSIVSTQ